MGHLAEGSPSPGAIGSRAIPADAILEELERVTQSEVFRRSDCLRRLLRYIVEQTLDGTGARLDEPSIRAAVFGGAGSPGPAANPLVRVETHRLRSKLAEYYATGGRQDRIEIALVRRGYSATFRDRGSGAPLEQAAGLARTLLVRRFENLEGRSKTTVFIAGFTAELLYALTQLRDLRIIAGTAWSAERVKDAQARPDVDAVLDGTVRIHGRRLRLGAQVTRADGTVLWSQIFERGTADVATQRNLASSISEGVRETLGIARKPATSAGPGESKAHLLHLTGCYHRDQHRPEALHKSIRCFEEAANLAPHFALAYAGLAEAYTFLAVCGERPVLKAAPAIRAAAMRALEMDPALPEAHVWLATAAAQADWDLGRADTEFQLALEMDPDNPSARPFYTCCCLLPVGRFEEAVAQVRRTVELRPLLPVARNVLGWALLFAGAFDDALSELRQAADLAPDLFLTYWSLGLLYEAQHKRESAIAAFLKARALCETVPFVLAGLGHACVESGMKEEAEGVLGEMTRLASHRYVPALDFATLYAGLGETRLALESLEKAAVERCAWMLWLGVDPRWRALHGEPRFHDLLQRMRLTLAVR